MSDYITPADILINQLNHLESMDGLIRREDAISIVEAMEDDLEQMETSRAMLTTFDHIYSDLQETKQVYQEYKDEPTPFIFDPFYRDELDEFEESTEEIFEETETALDVLSREYNSFNVY